MKNSFAAVNHAVENGRYMLVDGVFFLNPVDFIDFAGFREKAIGASHSQRQLSTSRQGMI